MFGPDFSMNWLAFDVFRGVEWPRGGRNGAERGRFVAEICRFVSIWRAIMTKKLLLQRKNEINQFDYRQNEDGC